MDYNKLEKARQIFDELSSKGYVKLDDNKILYLKSTYGEIVVKGDNCNS